MEAGSRITVMVVDDQPIYHDIARRVLASEPDIEVVTTAGTVKEALDQGREYGPDVVLMDQVLPDGKGTEAARLLRGAVHRTRIVMVTATADDRTVKAARKAGCVGYVLKDRLTDDLPAAVRSAFRGDKDMPSGGLELFAGTFGESSETGPAEQ